MVTGLKSSGFSIVELLMATAITVIVVIALTMFAGRSFNVSREQFEQVRITEDARIEMERMSDTIRNAKFIDLNGDTFTDATNERWLQSAKNYELVIYTNIDSDPELEKIDYFLDPGSTDLHQTVTQLDNTGQPVGTPVTYQIVRTVRNRTTAEAAAPASCTIDAECPLSDQCIVSSCLPPYIFTYYTYGSPSQAPILLPASDTASLSTGDIARVGRIGIRLIVDINERQKPTAVNLYTDVTPRSSPCNSTNCTVE